MYADAAFAIDARLVGDPSGRWITVDCRRAGAGRSLSRYFLQVFPAQRAFRLQRTDNNASVGLVGRTVSEAVRPGNEANRLELICVGSTIAARINGVLVASVEDAIYGAGQFSFVVNATNETSEARFDNLVVSEFTDLAALIPPPPSPALPPSAAAPPSAAPTVITGPPGAVLLADNFDDPEAGRLPRTSPDPAHLRAGYDGGKYRLEKLDPNDRIRLLELPGLYADTTLSVDVILSGANFHKVNLFCRFSTEPFRAYGYELRVQPPGAWVSLFAWNGNEVVDLFNTRQFFAVVRSEPGATNHIEFTCAGSTISARINGHPLVLAEDAGHTTGKLMIGLSRTAPRDPRLRDTIPIVGLFDNLVVTQPR